MADDGFSKKQLEQLEEHVIEPLIDGLSEAIVDSMHASFVSFGREFGQQLAQAMAPLFNEQNARLDGISTRLDRVIENTSGHWREHEQRLARIEKHLGITGNGAKNGDKK